MSQTLRVGTKVARVNGVRVHESVTCDRVLATVQAAEGTLDDPGICIICGEDADGCEPDMEKGECEHCGFPGVYGAQQLLIYLAS